MNINVDITFNSDKKKKERFPIHLVGVNQCLHCGQENTLEKIDIFGNTAVQEIYPLDRIRCRNCGYEYSIKWTKNNEGKLIPVPVNRSIKQEILNTMNYLSIKKKAEADIFMDIGERYRGD